MRALILGDTHNDLSHTRLAIEAAKRSDCEKIIQLGDWGFTWPHVGWWKLLDELLADAGIPMWFLDGNHDNFFDLRQRGLWRVDHPVSMTENITYLPRGVAWGEDGVSFLSLGGAVSIDQDHRILGSSWWTEEAITERDVAKALEHEHVDVMFTHDAPFGTRKIENLSAEYQIKYDNASMANRKAVRAVVDVLAPQRLYHGHWHARYTERLSRNIGELWVEGLGCNGMGQDSWTILDTESCF